MKRADQIPFSIDGTKCYEIVGKNRLDVLNKSRDGRPWKRDTRSNWTGYKSVRYCDCRGGFSCPNINCTFLLQFDEPNRVNFDKAGACMICSAIGDFEKCSTRKYVATLQDDIIHVFHHGVYTCKAKEKTMPPIKLVESSIATNPFAKPSEIQSNAILADLSQRKGWDEVKKTVENVTNIKDISNEKIKQKEKLASQQNIFESIRDLKSYVDEKDKHLIYKIDDNKQFVFKTPKLKMQLAREMQPDGINYMNEEFCFFDGNHSFVTLTASTYDPLLRNKLR